MLPVLWNIGINGLETDIAAGQKTEFEIIIGTAAQFSDFENNMRAQPVPIVRIADKMLQIRVAHPNVVALHVSLYDLAGRSLFSSWFSGSDVRIPYTGQNGSSMSVVKIVARFRGDRLSKPLVKKLFYVN